MCARILRFTSAQNATTGVATWLSTVCCITLTKVRIKTMARFAIHSRSENGALITQVADSGKAQPFVNISLAVLARLGMDKLPDWRTAEAQGETMFRSAWLDANSVEIEDSTLLIDGEEYDAILVGTAKRVLTPQIFDRDGEVYLKVTVSPKTGKTRMVRGNVDYFRVLGTKDEFAEAQILMTDVGLIERSIAYHEADYLERHGPPVEEALTELGDAVDKPAKAKK
jgi:hypothetical protein